MSILATELVRDVQRTDERYLVYFSTQLQRRALTLNRNLLAIGSRGSEVVLDHRYGQGDGETIKRNAIRIPADVLGGTLFESALEGEGNRRIDNQPVLARHAIDREIGGMIHFSGWFNWTELIVHLLNEGRGAMALCLVTAAIEGTEELVVCPLVPDTGLSSAALTGGRRVHFNEEEMAMPALRDDEYTWMFRQQEVQNGSQISGRQGLLTFGRIQVPVPLMEQQPAYSVDRVLDDGLTAVSQIRKLAIRDGRTEKVVKARMSVVFGRVDSFAAASS